MKQLILKKLDGVVIKKLENGKGILVKRIITDSKEKIYNSIAEAADDFGTWTETISRGLTKNGGSTKIRGINGVTFVRLDD